MGREQLVSSAKPPWAAPGAPRCPGCLVLLAQAAWVATACLWTCFLHGTDGGHPGRVCIRAVFSAGHSQSTHFHGTELNSPVCVNFKRKKKKYPKPLSCCRSLMLGVPCSGFSRCGALPCLFPTRWLPPRAGVRPRLACVCVGWTVPRGVSFESAVPRPRCQRLVNPEPLDFSSFVLMEARVTAE